MSARQLTAQTTSGSTAVGGGAGVEQSLIVNRALFEQQFLQCQVCSQKFDKSERKPKTLQCGHVFCLPCLRSLFAQPKLHPSLKKNIKCPTCHKEVTLSEKKIRELPNDFRVVQMLDLMNQSVTVTESCTKHKGQGLNFFCKKCSVAVCRDCTVVDHKEGNNHEIVDVHEVLDELRAQFQFTRLCNNQILMKMKLRSQYLVNAKENLKRLEESEKKKVDEKFSEYVKELQHQKEALKREIREKTEVQISKINITNNSVCEKIIQFQSLYNQFTQTTISNDISDLLTINENMKIHEERFRLVAAQDDAELFQSCEFTTENSLTHISKLGQVIVKKDQTLKEKKR